MLSGSKTVKNNRICLNHRLFLFKLETEQKSSGERLRKFKGFGKTTPITSETD